MDHGRPHTLTGRRAPHDSDGAIPLTLLIDLGGVCGGSSAGDAPLRSAVTTAHAYVSPRSPPPSRRLLSSGGAVGPPPLGGAAGACMWLFRTSRLGGERNQPRGGPAPGQSHLWIPRGKKQLFHPPLHGAPASYGQHATTETGRGAGGALPPQRTKMSSTANNIMEGGSLAQPKNAAASVGRAGQGRGWPRSLLRWGGGRPSHLHGYHRYTCTVASAGAGPRRSLRQKCSTRGCGGEQGACMMRTQSTQCGLSPATPDTSRSLCAGGAEGGFGCPDGGHRLHHA